MRHIDEAFLTGQYRLIPLHRLTKPGCANQRHQLALLKQIDGELHLLVQQLAKQLFIQSTTELHRTDRLPVEGDRHDPAQTGTSHTNLQPANGMMLAIHLNHSGANGREVITVFFRLVYPIEGSGWRQVELELLDPLRLDSGPERIKQIGEGLPILVGHRLGCIRPLGDQSRRQHGFMAGVFDHRFHILELAPQCSLLGRERPLAIFKQIKGKQHHGEQYDAANCQQRDLVTQLARGEHKTPSLTVIPNLQDGTVKSGVHQNLTLC